MYKTRSYLAASDKITPFIIRKTLFDRDADKCRFALEHLHQYSMFDNTC